MFAAYAFRYVSVRAPQWATRRALWTGVAVAGFAAMWQLDAVLFGLRDLPDWSMYFWPLGRPALDLTFVAVTLGSLFAFPQWQRILANPVFVGLSYVSYNLYIWHQIVADRLRDAKIPPWQTKAPQDDSAWQLSFTIEAFAVALLVSWLITHFVEQPLLRMRPFERFLTRPRTTTPVAAPVAAVLENG